MTKKITLNIPSISDDDIYVAMKDIPGYLDITPKDFKEIYQLACKHAIERYTLTVKACDIMTTDVVTANIKTPLQEVAHLMAQHEISGIPVINGSGKVAGVISEKDFLSHRGAKKAKSFMVVVAECLKNKGCAAISIKQGKAEDIMTSPAIVVYEDKPINEIFMLFRERAINRVPVLTQGGDLKGIICRGDLMGFFQ